MNRIEAELTRLPEPDAPQAFKAAVMARVQRLAEEDARRAPAFLAQARVLTEVKSASGEAGSWSRELPTWAAVLTGLAIVFGSWAYGRPELTAWITAESGVIGDLAARPFDEAALLGLALGLLLYAAGLFAPLDNRQRR